ncbi:MAG TPA: hypothetical protein VGK89_11510 [Candidatus Eisenbacteria bacterium]|jgi:hypothetical protein
MVAKQFFYVCAGIFILALTASIASASALLSTTEVAPGSAIGYEDDFEGCGVAPVQQDVTSEVFALDGAYAPRLEPCVVYDYFATGASQGFLDAVSLHFDLSPVGDGAIIDSLLLRVYLRKGTYSDSWHAIRLYPGAFSQTDEDCDNPGTCWTVTDEFPGTDGWEGWVERRVPSYWASGNDLDLSLRLWNAKLDAITLVVTTRSAPPPAPGMPTYAVGFEDDYGGCGGSPAIQNILPEIAENDGSYAPRIEPCVYVDYFATGQSQGYLDAVAANFDLAPYGGTSAIKSLTLRLYLQMGPYSPLWHAVRLYPGVFNSQDQDCDDYHTCWSPSDEFPGTPNWEGWIERPIPTEWASGSGLDLTIRIWNARVDALKLVVDAPTVARRETWGGVKARYRQSVPVQGK